MLRFGRHSSAGTGAAAWPALLFLALGVLAPSAALLWFINRAVQNEHLAVRQKLNEAYSAQTAFLANQAFAFWTTKSDSLKALRQGHSTPEFFDLAISRSLADGLAILDTAFPELPRSVAAPNETRLAPLDRRAQALQSSAREARMAGLTNEAIARHLELGGAEFENARDPQGRLLAPSADLGALEMLPAADPRRAEVEQRLRRRISYRNTNIGGSQRRFLAQEFNALTGQSNFSAQLAAELFTLEAREHLVARTNGLYARPDLGWSAFQTNELLILLKDRSLLQALQTEISHQAFPAGVIFEVLDPAAKMNSADLAHSPIPGLPGWRIAARLKNSDDLDLATRRQIAVYLWVGALVLGAVAFAGLATARLLVRQTRLARLKNDLLANVTHELKTPLASTRVLVETLIDSPKLDEKTTREYLDLIARENRRLTGLIENFLAYSRMERNKFSFTLALAPAAQIVSRAADAVRERFTAEGVQFSVRTDSDLPSIDADADSLETALLNLLENAYKYSRSPRRIELRAFARGDQVVFEVEDNGVGIPMREQRRIFERFYQVDQSLSRTTGGCGLGLSIVDFIVRAHQGTVRVKSEPSRGSTFSIEIPSASIPQLARA